MPGYDAQVYITDQDNMTLDQVVSVFKLEMDGCPRRDELYDHYDEQRHCASITDIFHIFEERRGTLTYCDNQYRYDDGRLQFVFDVRDDSNDTALRCICLGTIPSAETRGLELAIESARNLEDLKIMVINQNQQRPADIQVQSNYGTAMNFTFYCDTFFYGARLLYPQ